MGIGNINYLRELIEHVEVRLNIIIYEPSISIFLKVLEEIDLKKLAKLAGRKNVEMIHQKDLLPVTGYMRGGCSPVGMKKQFPTYMDESILKVDEVAFSAGKRGFQMIVKAQDILTYLNVETGDIIRK